MKVWIIGHIPPSDCFHKWALIYNALVNRFEFTIRAQFFGHLHEDIYQLQVDDSGHAYGVGFAAPATGTYNSDDSLNPSFRVYQVDALTKIPINYHQYRLNLTRWNAFPKEENLPWDDAYDMLSEYSLKNIWDLSNLQQLVEQIKKDKDVNKKFARNYWAGNLPQKYNAKTIHCLTISDPIAYLKCQRKLGKYLTQVMQDAVAGNWIESTAQD